MKQKKHSMNILLYSFCIFGNPALEEYSTVLFIFRIQLNTILIKIQSFSIFSISDDILYFEN